MSLGPRRCAGVRERVTRNNPQDSGTPGVHLSMIAAFDCATGWHLCSATLRPACKEGSCMDPTRLPQAPYGPRFGDGVRQEPTMERRIFMAFVSGGLLATPLAAEAQQAGKGWRIGYLAPQTRSSYDQEFLQGMGEL